MTITVAIAEMYRVPVIELVIAFEGVLILAIARDAMRVEVTETNGISSERCPRAACDREEVTENRVAVDLKVFHAERVGDSQPVRRQPRHTDIAHCVRALGLSGDVVLAEIENVGGRTRWRWRPARHSRIPIPAGKVLDKRVIRLRLAVDDSTGDIELLGHQ